MSEASPQKSCNVQPRGSQTLSDQKFCQLLGRIAQATSQQERLVLERQAKDLYQITKNLQYILKRGSIKLINEQKCPEYNYESAFNESLTNFIKNCQGFLNGVIRPDFSSWLINKDRQGCIADNIVRRYIRYFNKTLLRMSLQQFEQIERQTRFFEKDTIVVELIEEFDSFRPQEIDQIELRDCIVTLKKCLRSDRSKVFQTMSMRERPDCNCQRIALEFIDSEGNLAEVAKKLNVNYQALYSHWRRKCIPLLKKHCAQE